MNSFIHALDRLCLLIRRVNIAVLVVLVSVLTVVNVAQITGRFVFFYSLPWSEELSIYIFVWIIFLGGSISIRDNAELRLELIQPRSETTAARLRLLQDALSLIIMAILPVSSLMFMQNALRFRQLSSSLQISMAWIYAVIPLGYLLMLLEKTVGIVKGVLGKNVKA